MVFEFSRLQAAVFTTWEIKGTFGGPQAALHHANAEVLYDRAKMYLAL